MKRLRVIDLTQHLSGPYCTWTLAALGADVIKVEPVGRGDAARETPPFTAGRSIYFDSLNRGKRSIAIDLKTAEGQEVLAELLRHSDVLVENFRPGVRDRLGCSDAALARINDRLIVCSLSGFGQTGSHSGFPAFDIIAQAFSGLISINGPVDGEGIRVGVSIGDIAAGLFAAIGILGRLYERDVNGARNSAPLDISMVGCLAALMENAFARYLNAGEVPAPSGSRHPSMVPFETCRAADGALVVALGSNADWPRFCAAIGISEIEHDPRFRDVPARLENRDALDSIINARLAGHSVSHWLAALRDADIAAAPVMTVPEFAASGFAREAQIFVPAEEDASALFVRHPLASPGNTGAAPLLGEHGADILRELGLGEERIDALFRQGIVHAATAESLTAAD